MKLLMTKEVEIISNTCDSFTLLTDKAHSVYKIWILSAVDMALGSVHGWGGQGGGSGKEVVRGIWS